MSLFPTIEQAYAYVRREETRQSVMLAGSYNSHAVAMFANATKYESSALHLSRPDLHLDQKTPIKGKKTHLFWWLLTLWQKETY